MREMNSQTGAAARSSAPSFIAVESAGVAPFKLEPLPYGYADLEPVIDAETMKLHHDKHHQAYVDGVNKALEKYPEYHGLSIEEILRAEAELPTDIRQTVHNMGGGHANHAFFWQVMSPSNGATLNGELRRALDSTFGSFDRFREQFETAGTKHFGSGWVMLVADPRQNSKLEIVTHHDQDTPVMSGKIAVLSCDLWEHAYYLKYQNRRPEWLKAWWEVVNWEFAAERFASAGATTKH